MNEREFLSSVLGSQLGDARLLVPRGDDAAVVRYGEHSVVLTTDTYVEGKHFSFEYFSLGQAGAKAVEGAASDVVAMGGKPQFVLWSLVFGSARPVSDYREIAEGVEKACARVGAVLVGGNLAQGLGTLELTISVVGELPGRRLPVQRRGASAGDVVCVSGMLGASGAGLAAFAGRVPGFEQVKRAHVAPRCRIDLVDKLGAHATSMVDISDGLSSELFLLSEASGVALAIDEAKIPIHPEVRRFAAERGEDPLGYAYGGGEDYELLFTLPAAKAGLVPATVIGEVRVGQGVWVSRGGLELALERRGYDHVSG